MQEKQNFTVNPERINELAQLIQMRITNSVKQIDDINLETKLLSINAQAEAARAGEAGRAFGVVASSIVELSESTSGVAKGLIDDVQPVTRELLDISKRLSSDVRGQRLTDLALNNIELIDRNLYERTCDVRWWATDSSFVEACENTEDRAGTDFASKRMGVILNAYTVYFDLVLCDTAGRVLANGQPMSYSSAGKDVSNSHWFQESLKSVSGDHFGMESVHRSELTDMKRILVYSCAVRAGGEMNGKIIGVLGILFNWDSLAQTIVKRTAITKDEWKYTRAMIVDDNGRILADTDERIL
ncbi:MAG: chemotaxis protein, partial [Balneolaceae bacterium]